MGSHIFRFFWGGEGQDSSSYLRLADLPECLYCRWKVFFSAQKWLRWGSIIGHRLDYKWVGALRRKLHIYSQQKFTQVPSSPPPPRARVFILTRYRTVGGYVGGDVPDQTESLCKDKLWNSSDNWRELKLRRIRIFRFDISWRHMHWSVTTIWELYLKIIKRFVIYQSRRDPFFDPFKVKFQDLSPTV